MWVCKIVCTTLRGGGGRLSQGYVLMLCFKRLLGMFEKGCIHVASKNDVIGEVNIYACI